MRLCSRNCIGCILSQTAHLVTNALSPFRSCGRFYRQRYVVLYCCIATINTVCYVKPYCNHKSHLVEFDITEKWAGLALTPSKLFTVYRYIVLEICPNPEKRLAQRYHNGNNTTTAPRQSPQISSILQCYSDERPSPKNRILFKLKLLYFVLRGMEDGGTSQGKTTQFKLLPSHSSC